MAFTGNTDELTLYLQERYPAENEEKISKKKQIQNIHKVGSSATESHPSTI